MKEFFGSIEDMTLKNTNFRQVLFTSKHSQLVVMSIEPDEDVGNEVHPDNDQFFRIESGDAKFILNNKDIHLANDGDAVVVPAGTWHNVINMSKSKPLKFYTVYSPPNHLDGTIDKTKEDAEDREE